MRTPKEYTKSIKEGRITKPIITDCLYSVNKRAKNYRDSARLSRRCRNWVYADSAEERKEALYNQKDVMLSILTPDCIHVTTQRVKYRVYDYEEEYEEARHSGRVVHSNCYYDEGIDGYVYFVDVIEEEQEYFLFYDLGDCSFHHPIDDDDVERYKAEYGIDIKDIVCLVTRGADYKELISCQFVKKVVELIQSGNYQYVPA